MTLGGWLLVLGLCALTGFVLWVVDLEAPRLRRPVIVAMVGAVILMAAAPHLWWVLWAVGMSLIVAVIAAYVVAGFAAEVQRWRETRR